MADSIFEPEVSRSLKRLSRILQVPYPIAIECKKDTGTSLAMSRVTSEQEVALLQFTQYAFYQKMLVSSSVGGKSRFKLKSGFDFLMCPVGKSFVLVNFRATKKKAGSTIPKGTNQCFAVPIKYYLKSKAELIEQGRKSFPYQWFVDNAIEVERTKWEINGKYVYGWDLTVLFNIDTN